MNVSKRTAMLRDLGLVHALAGRDAPNFDRESNRKLRQLSRSLGLFTPRSHSNANRNSKRPDSYRKWLIARKDRTAAYRLAGLK